jgi:hypothetical protein
LNRWKNDVSHLLNINGIKDIRGIGVHKTESGSFDTEFAIEKFEKYKSPDTDHM